MPGPGDKFWENIKKTEVEKKPTLAGGNLSGVTSANAKSASAPDGYYAKLNDKIKLDLFGDRSNWDKIGYAEQTNLELATNTFFGTLTNIAGGIVEGVASNDIKGIVDMSLGNTEAKYGNILQQFANSIMEYGQENFHIYDDGSNSPFSFEYWGRQLQNLGYSTGIILEMFGEQALLAAATRGAGNAASAANLGKRFSTLKKLFQTASKPGIFGSYQGVKEAYLNGLQTGEETYQKYLDMGYDETTAKEKANEASTLGFRMEVLPLMTLNALQFAAIGKYNPFMKQEANIGFSGAFETLSNNVFKNVENKYLRKLADYTTQMVAEGIEEGIQTGIGKEAQYQVGVASGITGEQDVFDRIFEGDEMRDSIIGGALGGGMFRFMGKRFTKLSEGTKLGEHIFGANQKVNSEKHDEFLQDTALRVNNDLKDLKKAFDSGNQDKVDAVRKRMQRNNVFQALELDLMNKKESAFNTYVSTLEDINSAISSNDVEKMKSFGIENAEDVDYIKNNYQTFVNDAHSIKDKLVNNLQKFSDYHTALNVTHNEKLYEELTELEDRSKSNINDLKSSNKQYNRLTDIGKKKFDLAIEASAIIGSISQGTATNQHKERLAEIKQEVKELEESNKRYLGKKNDGRIIDAINTDDFIREHLNVIESQLHQDLVTDKLKYWNNPKNQEKERQKRLKKQVKRAKSKKDLQDTKEQLQKEGNLDSKTEQEITNREKEIDNANKEAVVKEKVAETKTETPTPKPKEKVQEDTKEAKSFEEGIDGMSFDEIAEATKAQDYEVKDVMEFGSRQIPKDFQVSEKNKTNMNNYLNDLSRRIGKQPNFEDVIVDRIKSRGYESTEDRFNAYATFYESVRDDLDNKDDIYSKFFTPEQELENDIDNVFGETLPSEPSQKKVEEANVESESKVRKTTQPQKNFKPNSSNTYAFNPEDKRTTSGALKFAYNFQQVEYKDGEWNITSRNLKSQEDDIVNNHYILDSEFMNQVRKEPGSLVLRQIDDETVNIGDKTWGEAKAEAKKKFGDTAQYENWFKQRVPVAVIYEGKLTNQPVALSLIHTNEWYNDKNVNDTTGEAIAEGIENVTALREQVATLGTVPIQLQNSVENSFGQIHKLPKGANPISLNEATGDTMIGQVSSTNGELQVRLTKSGGGKYFSGNLLNTNFKSFIDNTTLVHINQVGVNSNGDPLYMAFPVMNDSPIAPQENLKNNIHPKIFNTVKYATLASTLLNNKDNAQLIIGINKKYNFTEVDAQNIQKQIKKETGIDITSNLGGYTGLFVKSNYQGGLTNVLSNDNLPNGITYINSNKDGSIEFVFKGSDTKKKTIGNKFPNVEAVLANLETFFGGEGLLHKTKANVNLNALNNEFYESLTMINENGKLEQESKSYDDHIKDILKTNIVSHKIETIQGNEKWITDVQPMFYFNPIGEQVKIEDTQEIENNVPETKVENESDLEKRVREIKQNDLLSQEEKDLAIAIITNSPNNNTYESRLQLSQDARKKIKDLDTNKVDSLTDGQQKELVESLKHLVINNIDFNKEGLKYSDIKQSIVNSIDDFIVPQLEKSRNLAKVFQTIPNSENNLRDINLVINKLDNIVKQKEKLISDSGSLIKEFTNLLSIDFSEQIQDEVEEENYSKSFLEKDIKLSYSGLLKMSLFGIPKKVLGTGTVERNVFGLNRFNSADSVNLKLLDITTSIPSNWTLLNQRIDDMYKKTGNDLYIDLKNKLNRLPEHLKNELLYKTIGKKLTIWKVLNSPGKPTIVTNKDTGKKIAKVEDYTITILDENSSKETIKLRQQLERDYLSSNFAILNSNGEIVLNRQYAQNIVKQLKSLMDSKELDRKSIQDIFSKTNLQLFNNNTIDYLIQQQGTLLPNGKKRDMFGNTGIIGLMYKELSNTFKKSGDILLDNNDNNLFKNMSTPLKELIDIETMLNKSFVANSINVNGKTMQSVIANTALYDINQRLLSDDTDLIDTYLSIPYTSNNYVLQILKNDAKLKDVFGDIGFSSPEAIKLHGRDSFGDADFDKIAEQDNLATVLGLYMNTRGTTLSNDKPFKDYKGLSFRLGQMPIHTISDKGRMVYLKVPLLNLEGNQIQLEDGEMSLDSEVMDFLTEQIFTSEYNRILQSYKQDTSITSYDKSSKIFHFIPSFNSITIAIDGKELNIHDILQNLNGSEVKQEYYEELKNQAKRKIFEYLKSEVDTKISKDGTKGKLAEFAFYDSKDDKYGLHNINTSYIKTKPGNSNLEKLRYSMMEFSINNLLSNVNTQQLYIGDLSFYSKDKFVPTTSNGKIDTTELSKPEVYGEISKSISAVLQKRTASLIAPGLKLADSENVTSSYAQDFVHLALNDVESMSSVMKELIENQYGKFNNETNTAWDKLQTIKNKIAELQNQEQDNSDKIKYLNGLISDIKDEFFSELADYFNITGTDAQEYTTWKTHLDMLLRQGKITRSQYNDFSDRVINNKELTTEELDIILQPVKPVYTGMVYDSKYNIMRPVYIKSSSFPLMPQLTTNLKIDGLRTNMEALENKHNKPVRASYQSANKIGSLNTNLNMQDLYDNDLTTLEQSGKIDSAMSILPMSNFKIQQETPSKETKYFHKGKDAHIRMGSQFFKILFGNFINHSNDSVFDNLFTDEVLDLAGVEKKDKLSGKQLYDIYNKVYEKYSDFIKFQLEDELGFEIENFESSSVETQNNIIKNIQKLLEKEITERNYPDYLKDSINVIEEDNKLMIESTLMFDNNRYKFEALLQAIISNRLITHTLPGNSHISASSEGFERKDTLDALSQEEKQGIVWINGYQSELKPTFVTTEDGKEVISKSQVLVKSHFKYINENGDYEYVDLTSDKYSENILDDNGNIVGRKLKENMIDENLLSNFSFRIPTSSHQSGAIIEIVGFLPPQVGDLLVVPKEHTTQIGEDYDIDKRSVYKSNYFVNPNSGRVSKLNGDIIRNNDAHINKLLTAIFNERYADVQEIAPSRYEREKQILLLENAIIDIYKSIYSTTNTGVQQKVFKPLVTDISGDTANLMDEYLKEDEDLSNFSLLSDDYQRYLLKMGADGKGGIGVHSNAVVLEAQFQRLNGSDKVHLGEIIYAKDTPPEYNPFNLRIGNLSFSDVVGQQPKTLDGNRDIADQHGENQNVSTDNINKQIMGKRNENSYTMSVYALMAHMGFDLSSDVINTGIDNGKGSTVKQKLHIPSLYINQPIIRDYVALKQKYDSITAEFTQDKETQIVKDLAEEYGFNMLEAAVSDKSSDLTGQFLWDNLKKDIAKTNPEQQATILLNFLKMDEKAKEISKIQQLINLSTSKLGVSYFDVLQRVSVLDDIAYRQLDAKARGLQANNYTNLIGEFSVEPKEDFIKVGRYYWKPTTIEGRMLVNSVHTANKIMPIFFPYQSNIVQGVLESIFNNKNVSINDKSQTNTNWKYEIMTEFVNYINSDIGVFEGDIDQERNRLFFDDESTGQMSLASILKQLKLSKHPVMSNLFLQDLSFDKNIQTGVHEILHTPDEQTNFDKSSKYEAFLELLKNDNIVRDKSGNPILFNRRELKVSDLAQDLVAYSYLSNDKNGAIGFKNYIPAPYLSIIGTFDNYRTIFNNIKSNSFDTDFVENFVKQYFQHKPNRAKVVSSEEFKELNKLIKEGEEAAIPQYVSIRDTKKGKDFKQWQLFKFNDVERTYKRLSILGTNNSFNEYNISNAEQKSQTNDSKLNASAEVIVEKGNKYIKIQGNNIPLGDFEKSLSSQRYPDVESLLTYIFNSPNTSEEYKKLISELQEYVNIDVNLEWNDKMEKNGMYNPSTNTISINPRIYENLLNENGNNWTLAQQQFREVVLEEVLHSMTVREMDKYIEFSDINTGDFKLKDNAPIFMTKIAKAFEEARKAVPYDEDNPSTYYSKNIHEFVAGMFVAEDYRAELENESSGFVDNFLKAIRELLKHLYKQTTGTYPNYKDEIFSAVKNLLKENKSEFGTKGIEVDSNKTKIENIRDSKINEETVNQRPLENKDIPTQEDIDELPPIDCE